MECCYFAVKKGSSGGSGVGLNPMWNMKS